MASFVDSLTQSRVLAAHSAWHALALRSSPPDALSPVLAALPARLDALRHSLAGWHASGAPGSDTVFAHADLQHGCVGSLLRYTRLRMLSCRLGLALLRQRVCALLWR
jgi:hypothetical protein